MPMTDLSRRPAHLRGVIFDMDGVIVDSEPLGLGPAGVIAIEDSVSGVAAAIAAGLACVAVRTMLTTGHDHGAAALTVDSLTELDLQVLDRIAAGASGGSAVAGGPASDSRARTGLSPLGSASFDDGVASAGH